MPAYRVTVSLKTETPCDTQDIADYVAVAVAEWGGQYSPDDEFFPTNIVQVQATCRGRYKTYRRE